MLWFSYTFFCFSSQQTGLKCNRRLNKEKAARHIESAETKQGSSRPGGNWGQEGRRRTSALFMTPSNQGWGGASATLHMTLHMPLPEDMDKLVFLLFHWLQMKRQLWQNVHFLCSFFFLFLSWRNNNTTVTSMTGKDVDLSFFFFFRWTGCRMRIRLPYL